MIYKHFDDLLERIYLADYQTEEQKEIVKKRREERLSKNSGCMLITILLVSIPSLIAFLI